MSVMASKAMPKSMANVGQSRARQTREETARMVVEKMKRLATNRSMMSPMMNPKSPTVILAMKFSNAFCLLPIAIIHRITSFRKLVKTEQADRLSPTTGEPQTVPQ